MRYGVVTRRLAIGTPQALELESARVPHRDALVAVTVCGHQLIGSRQKADLGDALHIVGIQASLAGIGMADLAQELAVRAELQDEGVMISAALAATLARGGRRSGCELRRTAWGRTWLARAVSAQPDIAILVDGDAMV